MWQAFIATNDTPRDKPRIEWLEEVIEIAERLLKQILEENKERNPKLAESG